MDTQPFLFDVTSDAKNIFGENCGCGCVWAVPDTWPSRLLQCTIDAHVQPACCGQKGHSTESYEGEKVSRTLFLLVTLCSGFVCSDDLSGS